jgi:hypothetical protein
MSAPTKDTDVAFAAACDALRTESARTDATPASIASKTIEAFMLGLNVNGRDGRGWLTGPAACFVGGGVIAHDLSILARVVSRYCVRKAALDG